MAFFNVEKIDFSAHSPLLKKLFLSFSMLALVVVPSAALADSDDIRDARDEREAAANAEAAAAEALDVTEAEHQEVSDALTALDDYIELQEAKIATARQAIEAAEAETTLRWIEAAAVDKEIVALREQLQILAVDAYVQSIRPGTLLEAEDLTAGARKSAILDAVTGDREDLVSHFTALEADREEIARSAEDAIIDAERQQRELEISLVILDQRIVAKEALQDELQDRIGEYEEEVREFEREQYLLAILIDNLIAEELRNSAPELTEESASGFIMPIEGTIGSRDFGVHVHPIFGTERMHNGVDIGCVMDQPIWAAKAGSVISAGWRNGYGNTVMIEHDGGIVTVYAHLNQVLVSSGHSVNIGELIGKCGSTGWSTGPHLHFETRVGSVPHDPVIFLP
ncbi:MAG: Lysostaphin [Acidimicrobiales bacterium AG-410-I20]|nr:MAG: Lysostaphin [Acidimicrobiales bacterium AG-410-I20]